MKSIEKTRRGKTNIISRLSWLGRLDSNQGMAESKSAALPLGYAPTRWLAPRIAAGSAEFNETLRLARSRSSNALASPSPGGGGSAKHRAQRDVSRGGVSFP